MRALFLLALGLPVIVAPACVGDSSITNPDGSTDSSLGDVSLDVPTTDAAADVAAEAEAGPPPCGAPGETCCQTPLAPCNDGLTCNGGNKCAVSEAWAVGEYSYQNTSSALIIAFVVAHYDGSTWTLGTPIKSNTFDFNSYDPVDIYEQGTDVRVISNEADVGHEYWWSGVSWQTCASFSACTGPTMSSYVWAITSVSNSGSVDYWVAGSSLMSRCASTSSSCASTATGITGSVGQGTFAGSLATDLWYAQYGQVLHYDGTQWTTAAVTEAFTIGGASTSDLWTGYHKLQHWDGKAWSSAYLIAGSPAPGNILSIGASSSTDVHAVGNDGTQTAGSFAAHWDGTGWKLETLPSMAHSQKVWAPSPIDAFMVGSAATSNNTGVIAHWDGTKWSAMTSPPVSYPDEKAPGGLTWISVTGQARPRGN
jgi:hypothetical protein